MAGHNDGVNADRRRREAAIYAGENVPTSSGQSVATDQAPGGQTDYTRLAYAYANGRMTPEDMALYERGMAEGVFPRATRPEPPPEPVRPDPLAIYAAATQRNRVSELPVFQPFQLGGLR
ncbi:MAG: hypothetical protein U5N55_07910 [Cypionkella sp.]|nr:hypothetical protein [Cypionkella sp.]